ncbi:MAG: hypothetical protein VXX04_06090, partial [Actinomycetota bacterium]|nr:hypothetical protein [Actinomycetota bacterium]
MEFQVLSVTLEDRYPQGRPENVPRDQLFEVDSLRDCPRSNVVKSVPGCVAFLFGRCADGKSICVCTEGVLPYLYFSLEPEET